MCGEAVAIKKQDIVFSSDPVYTIKYSAFKGVDYSTDEMTIDRSRSPIAVNLISDAGGYPNKRLGWRTVYQFPDDGAVNGIFHYEQKGEVIAHIGTKIYKLVLSDTTSKTLLLEGVFNGISQGFQVGGKLYLLTGEQYLVYDGTKIEPVKNSAFTPITSISRLPTGGGKTYQAVNFLQKNRKNTFITDGASKEFLVDSFPIDSTGECKAWLNDELVTGFTVDRENGKFIFSTAPVAPSNDGVATLMVEFPKAVKSDTIEKCRFYGTYGLSNDNRIFLSGNGDHAATVYYSALNDPSYFPDLNYTQVGSDDFPIMCFLKAQGRLAVIKKDNDQEATIYHYSAEQSTDGAVFPLREGISGVGAISSYTAKSFLDDPLFLSTNGVFTNQSSYNSSKYDSYVKNRSYYVNARLCKEPNLNKAVAHVWNGLYLLCVNGHCYVADSKQGYSNQYGYEWYFWDNISAVCFCTINDSLFWGTADGKICRFNDDKVDADGNIKMEAYNDDGKPIVWKWATKFDDMGDNMTLKTMPKRGSGVHLKPYTRSSVGVYIRTNKDHGKLATTSYVDVFDFNDLDFSRLSFNTLDNAIIPIKVKKKKWQMIQIILKGEELNEGFGVFGITLRYSLGNYAKR